jgi:hypothetical protein
MNGCTKSPPKDKAADFAVVDWAHQHINSGMQIWPSVPFHAPTSPPYQEATKKANNTKRKQGGGKHGELQEPTLFGLNL